MSLVTSHWVVRALETSGTPSPYYSIECTKRRYILLYYTSKWLISKLTPKKVKVGQKIFSTSSRERASKMTQRSYIWFWKNLKFKTKKTQKIQKLFDQLLVFLGINFEISHSVRWSEFSQERISQRKIIKKFQNLKNHNS